MSETLQWTRVRKGCYREKTRRIEPCRFTIYQSNFSIQTWYLEDVNHPVTLSRWTVYAKKRHAQQEALRRVAVERQSEARHAEHAMRRQVKP